MEVSYLLSVSEMILLKHGVSCNNCPATELNDVSLLHLNKQILKEIDMIQLHYITNIDTLQCCHIIKLDLHGNQIKNLPDMEFWSEFKGIQLLYLHDNQIGILAKINHILANHSLVLIRHKTIRGYLMRKKLGLIFHLKRQREEIHIFHGPKREDISIAQNIKIQTHNFFTLPFCGMAKKNPKIRKVSEPGDCTPVNEEVQVPPEVDNVFGAENEKQNPVPSTETELIKNEKTHKEITSILCHQRANFLQSARNGGKFVKNCQIRKVHGKIVKFKRFHEKIVHSNVFTKIDQFKRFYGKIEKFERFHGKIVKTRNWREFSLANFLLISHKDSARDIRHSIQQLHSILPTKPEAVCHIQNQEKHNKFIQEKEQKVSKNSFAHEFSTRHTSVTKTLKIHDRVMKCDKKSSNRLLKAHTHVMTLRERQVTAEPMATIPVDQSVCQKGACL
ncbi:hypothetical protein XELAEV_18022942mg [Xenopus laevis]|uniref:Uncharacterized protein n=1 Tax=Xenopus laevis TaxID=8355 RepID=A0A974HNU6_XENLA|nr:hypothetical protein XELAEV_18022942mg [Xenopus laevis]